MLSNKHKNFSKSEQQFIKTEPIEEETQTAGQNGQDNMKVKRGLISERDSIEGKNISFSRMTLDLVKGGREKKFGLNIYKNKQHPCK